MTPARDPALLEPLEAVLRLRIRRGILGVALAAALAFSGGLLSVAMLVRFGVTVDNPVAWALLAAGIVTALGLYWVWRQRRPAHEIAFDIDRRAGLGQRYGTAVEVDPAADGAVALALRRAGREDAAGLDPAGLVPLATRSVVGAGVLIVLICAALPLLTPLSPTDRSGPDPVDAVAPKTEVEALLEAAREVARLLAADAERHDNSFLAAIARAIDEKFASADDVARLREQLERYLDLAAKAYGDRPPEWLGAGSMDRVTETQGLLEQIRDRQVDPAARSGEAPGGLPQTDPEYDTDAATREAELRRASALAASPGPETDYVPLDGAEAALVGDGVRLMEVLGRKFEGGIPVGAALQSGRGLSNLAGMGTQTLERDEAFVGLAAALGEDMVLTATPEPGGRRIRIEVAPEIGPKIAAGAAGALAQRPPRPDAAAQHRQFVAADRREVTSRYFARAPQ